MIRLGAPIFGEFSSPDEWVAVVKREGWSAAYCPIQPTPDTALIRSYADAAAKAGILIAEVGVWNNPISPNVAERRANIQLCKDKLALAEEIGAACCVNIAGSCNPTVWHGPHPRNFVPDTLDLIVQTTRDIIDAVKPKRTFYTLEAMPWICPDTPNLYEEMIRAIDRKAFGVHLDPVNFIVSPRTYFDNSAILEASFRILGPHIKSCHAKDIHLREEPVAVMFDEVRPGLGAMDYRTYLGELSLLNREISLMLEHLPNREEYRLAGDFIREKAKATNVPLR